MSYWNSLGLLRKDRRKCFQRAFLLVRANGEIKKYPFKFSTINDDAITDAESAIPMNYDKRTKAIFTPNINLNFVNGGRVEFLDGTTMTISAVIKQIDEQKALSDGEGVIGLNIYFGG